MKVEQKTSYVLSLSESDYLAIKALIWGKTTRMIQNQLFKAAKDDPDTFEGMNIAEGAEMIFSNFKTGDNNGCGDNK
jgi:hypothetical protein